MDDEHAQPVDTKTVALILSIQSIAMIAIGVGLWWLTGRPLGGFISFKGWEFALGAAIAMALISISLLISYAAPEYRKRLIAEQARHAPGPKQPFTLFQIVLISAGAGIGEEALFRGGLQVLLGDHLPPLLAIAIAAALFSLLHLQSRRIALIILSVGCIFGLAFYISGSLLAAILGHALYDIWAMIRSQREMESQGFYDKGAQDR